MKPGILICVISMVFSLALRAQDDDPMKYFDDGGKSNRNNLLYWDVTYLHRPAYVFGYERRFSPRFSASAGIIFLNDMKIYKLPSENIDVPENLTYRKADNALNFSLMASYFFYARRNFHNYASLGFNVTHYDSARTQDLYISKSVVAYELNRRFFISLDLQLGIRFEKIEKNAYVNDWTYYFINGERPPKISLSPYLHVPLRIGIKF